MITALGTIYEKETGLQRLLRNSKRRPVPGGDGRSGADRNRPVRSRPAGPRSRGRPAIRYRLPRSLGWRCRLRCSGRDRTDGPAALPLGARRGRDPLGALMTQRNRASWYRLSHCWRFSFSGRASFCGWPPSASRRLCSRGAAAPASAPSKSSAEADSKTSTEGRTADYPAIVPDLLCESVGRSRIRDPRFDPRRHNRIFDNEYLGQLISGRGPWDCSPSWRLIVTPLLRGSHRFPLRQSAAGPPALAAGSGLPGIRPSRRPSTTSSASPRRPTSSCSWRRCAPVRPQSR